MLKLSRSLLPRKGLAGKISNVEDFSWLSSFTSRLGISTARAGLLKDGNGLGKTYADYSVFKGKAALTISPILPKFSKLDSGSSKVEKKGVVLLKFMPAVGQRKYDWEKRQVFALSPTEVGCLISLGPAESCEFFHDPSMKSSLEGQVKKTLTVTPLANEGGYFFNLNVMNSIQKTSDRFSVPVTKAEFAVMRTAFNFALPHIMGWDQVVQPQPEGNSSTPLNQPEIRLDPEFEWGR